MQSSSSHSVSLCHFDEGGQLGAKVGNRMTNRFSYVTGLVSVKHHVLHIEVDGGERSSLCLWSGYIAETKSKKIRQFQHFRRRAKGVAKSEAES